MALNEPTLLDRFRVGTRAAQDALSRAESQHRLNDATGLGAYLSAQAEGVATFLAAKGETPGVPHEALAKAKAQLAADLEALARPPAAKARHRPRVDDPLARGFVWHSRKMTYRMRARDLPAVGAGRFFLTAPRDVPAWRALCATLEETPGYGPAGDAALTAANDWFALLETIHHGYR